MRLLVFIAFISAFATVSSGQNTSKAKVEFKTDSALEAVAEYEEKLAYLQKRMREHVALAKKQLTSDLQASMNDSIESRNFAEIERISTFLQGKTTLSTDALSSTDKATITSLKLEVTKLKSELKVASQRNRKKIFQPIVFSKEMLAGRSIKFTNGIACTKFELKKDGAIVPPKPSEAKWRVTNGSLEFLGRDGRTVTTRWSNAVACEGFVFAFSVYLPDPKFPHVLIFEQGRP